jgi:hypothetical protein
MNKVVVSQSSSGWTWWLQSDHRAGCEVLVRGVSSYADESACRGAAWRFSRVEPGLVLSVQDEDGYWRLSFHDLEGDKIAVSADRFADARTSRLELDRIRHAVGRTADVPS